MVLGFGRHIQVEATKCVVNKTTNRDACIDTPCPKLGFVLLESVCLGDTLQAGMSVCLG